KIKGACKIVRDAGFRLIWIDSCCIDKSSSAELAEAINSMFKWYKLSKVCYVFLEDVPGRCENAKDQAARFRKSRWHTRSWTLQELVAPTRVQFYARCWCFLGTKEGLAKTLEKATGIHTDILTGRAAVESTSVAQRLSWAAKRRATRVEDEAYSLMGLFGVYMTLIYGEGKNAFLRLQEEIAKANPDQTQLAW
ncbi:uncharacterized protein TRAVEDRAFT_86618, partial [Trametes versicolor FP-101664 SS1]|uniref:uncharacterized protein n=1 Tax=Trametes versicolor (strain FP-101664) TaxID=717944 RepID=UPI0004622664